jgi:hypothetical protein
VLRVGNFKVREKAKRRGKRSRKVNTDGRRQK